MDVPADLRYTAHHEWLRLDGDEATIGITDYAQSELGDVVYVQLPEVGGILVLGKAFGEIESVKTVSDLYAPVSGTVIAVNEALADTPELVNRSPYDDGWMLRIHLATPSEVDALLDAGAYRERLPANEA